MDEAEVGRLVGDLSINYTVRELLARIEERQIRTDVRIEDQIKQLASRAEVEHLAEMVSRHEARWNRMIGAAIAVGALAGGATGYLANVLAAAH